MCFLRGRRCSQILEGLRTGDSSLQAFALRRRTGTCSSRRLLVLWWWWLKHHFLVLENRCVPQVFDRSGTDESSLNGTTHWARRRKWFLVLGSNSLLLPQLLLWLLQRLFGVLEHRCVPQVFDRSGTNKSSLNGTIRWGRGSSRGRWYASKLSFGMRPYKRRFPSLIAFRRRRHQLAVHTATAQIL